MNSRREEAKTVWFDSMPINTNEVSMIIVDISID